MLTLPKLKKKAWRLYSIKRRQAEADFQDHVVCYTCDKRLPWKEAHLGHFKHHKVDFDPRNTRIQCTGCNTFRDGRLDVYALRLIREIGLEEVEDLERKAAQFKGYSRKELEEIIKLSTAPY